MKKRTRVDRAASIIKNKDKTIRKLGRFFKESKNYYYEFCSGKAQYICPGAERAVEWTECKECTVCHKNKFLTLYPKNNQGRNNIFSATGRRYRRPDCKVCNSNNRKGTNKAIADAKTSGISVKAPTGTKCALCGEGPSSKKGEFVFDHDHETNEFRGYIHNRCNIGLGILGDSVLELLKAVKYLNIGENLSKDVIISELFGE